jgi:uncharacterized protein (DUF1330 family)
LSSNVPPGFSPICHLTRFAPDDPAAFKTNVAEPAAPIVKKHGGQFVARTDNITVLRAGDPPLKRYVIIGFDNIEQAKAWYNSEDWKPISTYLDQHTKGRAFAVETLAQQ